MTYTSIATFLHDPGRAPDILDYAIQAARKWGAHLYVICAGIDSTDPGFYYAGAQAIAVQTNLETAQLDANALEQTVRTRLEQEDILWDIETVTMMINGLEPFLADHLRFYDLAILPQPYAESSNFTDVTAFEACLFGADMPVLVIPEGKGASTAMDQIMIAWDDGAEALAAARAAMPITGAAKGTDICLINPPKHGHNRSDPGGRMAQMLTRKGANVQITLAPQRHHDIATQLLERARETGVDLLVMGGYGHSRLREAVLGGVTRTVLGKAHLPVLMAH